MTSIHIRRSVFETNSSSSHSLTVRERDLAQMPFDEQTMRQGVVYVSPDHYGWEWMRYYQPANKIAYLLAQITGGDLEQGHMDSDEFTRFLCEQYPDLALICQTVERHTGCIVQFQGGECGIDHESQGNGLQTLSDPVELEKLLFSPYSYIETGNDNSSAPSSIQTDDGSSEPYHSPRSPEMVVKSNSRRPSF